MYTIDPRRPYLSRRARTADHRRQQHDIALLIAVRRLDSLR